MGVHGNEKADSQAEKDRAMHPDTEVQAPKRCRLWEDLGLQEMADEDPHSDRSSSGGSSSDLASLGWQGEESGSDSESSSSSGGGTSADSGSVGGKRVRH